MAIRIYAIHPVHVIVKTDGSFAALVNIQKTAAGWLAGAGASDLRVAVCLASSRLVQRDTVRSRGYLQPYSYFYHLHSVSYFIGLQSAHTFYLELTNLTCVDQSMCVANLTNIYTVMHCPVHGIFLC